MKRTQLSFLVALAAGPALAQEGAAEAVGTGLGLVIGLLIMIVVGAVVGWLAGLIVKGSGLGFWGDVVVGIGGSIPLVADLETVFPEASILLTGVGEPTSRIHGPDESQDLEELRRNCLAEAIALTLIGDH